MQLFKREGMMYSIPENLPFRINDGVEVPSNGTSDYGEECDDKDEESSNSEWNENGDNEGQAVNDGSEKKKAEKAAKKKVIRHKENQSNIYKKFKHVDMPAEMWARRISLCETHEERLLLLEQAATEWKGYLLGVSAALSIPVATSKAIAEILRLLITRSEGGQMHLKQLFVDSNQTVSLEPIPLVCAQLASQR